MRIALGALVLVVPTLAAARPVPVTIGVSAGLAQSKDDASAGADAPSTFGLFGRVGFSRWVAAQVEVGKITADAPTTIRTETLVLVIDLASHSHLVPVLLGGVGLGQATAYSETTDEHHFEGGVGLEYRSDGGLTIGVDARIGTRAVDTPADYASPGGGALYYTPQTLRDGEYRSVRATLGVRF